MSDQLDLFGGGAVRIGELAVTRPSSAMARRSDPETSHGAAVIALHDVNSLRARCLEALREHGPMTDFELGAVVHRKQTSAGKRRLELMRDGLVEPVVDDGGLPVRRPSDTGSPARVWRAVS